MKVFRLLVVFLLFAFSFKAQAQMRYSESYNRLGIKAGLIYGGINSNDLSTSPRTGFTGGLHTRANVYNKLIAVYGINFFQHYTGVALVQENGTGTVETDFKATGVQLNLFAGHKIIGDHLSVEAGPVLQINSKWSPEDNFRQMRVRGYDIMASDLEEISRINLSLAGGVSAGFESFKFIFQYQYGLTNIFRGLNSEELGNKDPRAAGLRGHQHLAIAGIIYYL